MARMRGAASINGASQVLTLLVYLLPSWDIQLLLCNVPEGVVAGEEQNADEMRWRISATRKHGSDVETLALEAPTASDLLRYARDYAAQARKGERCDAS